MSTIQISDIQINSIGKCFEDTVALDNIELKIKSGSFFTLLGPSGCGKTTLLRIMAGFLKPDVGAIWMGQEEITNKPVEARQIGMVFQNYALFPHMNVAENIAYGLKVKKIASKQIAKKVAFYL